MWIGSTKLLFKASEHSSWEGASTLPDIDELSNLLLIREKVRESTSRIDLKKIARVFKSRNSIRGYTARVAPSINRMVLRGSSRERTFCSSGAVLVMSVMIEGSSSVTWFTPAANVPSDAPEPGVCPALRACSTHCRVTESITYSTPSL